MMVSILGAVGFGGCFLPPYFASDQGTGGDQTGTGGAQGEGAQGGAFATGGSVGAGGSATGGAGAGNIGGAGAGNTGGAGGKTGGAGTGGQINCDTSSCAVCAESCCPTEQSFCGAACQGIFDCVTGGDSPLDCVTAAGSDAGAAAAQDLLVCQRNQCGTCHSSQLCVDGVQNSDETGTDCGGQRCFPCNVM